MNNSSKIKLIILVIIFCCNMFWSSGRGTIEGVVKNSGGETVDGATVTATPLGYTAETDSNGAYIITDILTGTYAMSASYDSLSGSSSTIVSDGGFFSCAGKTATCDITISSVSSSGWETLSSPLSGTYSGEGYYLTESNSPYDITSTVYFYDTNVDIGDNVVIRFVRVSSLNIYVLFGDSTTIVIGDNVEINNDEGANGAIVYIEEGSDISLSNIDVGVNMDVKRNVTVIDSDISVLTVNGNGDSTIQYSDFSSLSFNG